MWGDGRIYQRGSKYWIAYCVRGREVREPAGLTAQAAKKLLKVRLHQIHAGTLPGREAEALTVDDLLDALVSHLELRGAKSLVPVRSHLKPIRSRFGFSRALGVTAAQVQGFARERLALGKTPATVNRGLQLLNQAYNLARKQGRLARGPYIPLLREDNARQGFFERDEFEAVTRHLSSPVDEVARFAYLTGWRKGEILGLRWEMVDRAGREIRLPTSKNDRGRVLPLEGALAAIIERRWQARRFRRPDGVLGLAAHVFHRQGRPIGEFRKSWATACRKAELPGKLFHDLRRTGVRNMIRAGVPESVAMAISGHRTISMFLRYNITSDQDMREALRRIERV